MIDPIQTYLILPRGFELIIYTLCAILLLKKQKTKSNTEPGNYLRLLYIIAFLSWSIYMILDIVTSLIIGLSITYQYIEYLPKWYFPIKFTGYFSGFPSVTLANILRDFQMIAAMSMIILTYFATQVIKNGKALAIKKMKDIKIIAFFAITGFTMVFFDMKEIVFQNPSSMTVSGSWDSLGVEGYLGFLLYIGVMTYSTAIIFNLYMKSSNKKDISVKSIKRKLLGFNIGYLFLSLGMWYWVLEPELQQILNFTLHPIVQETVGHILWIIAPIAFYFALRADKYQIIKN